MHAYKKLRKEIKDNYNSSVSTYVICFITLDLSQLRHKKTDTSFFIPQKLTIFA